MANDHEIPPAFQLYRLATSFYISRALYVLAELRIADLLAEGPLSHVELAEQCDADAANLRRVLRLAAAHGVCEDDKCVCVEGWSGETDCSEKACPGDTPGRAAE